MQGAVKLELERIRQQDGGFLNPHRVVEIARSPENPLHEHFEWDDTEAAERYRLAQARALIRVAVIVNEKKDYNPVRAYVSLTTDRYNQRGYRAMVDIVNDEVLVETMLKDAIMELQSFQRKYNKLRDVASLSPVFEALEGIASKEGAA